MCTCVEGVCIVVVCLGLGGPGRRYVRMYVKCVLVVFTCTYMVLARLISWIDHLADGICNHVVRACTGDAAAAGHGGGPRAAAEGEGEHPPLGSV